MPAGMGTQTGPLVHVTVQQPLFDNQLVQQLLQMTGQVSQNAPWMLQSQMAQLGAPQCHSPERTNSSSQALWQPPLEPAVAAPFGRAAGPGMMQPVPPPTSAPPPWCTITSWGQQDTLEIESLVGSAR